MRSLFLILVATIFTLSATAQTQVDKKDNETTKEQVVLKVNMHCTSCAEKVRKQLAFTKGVKSVEVNFEKGVANVIYDSKKTNPDLLIASLKEINYEATVVQPGGCKGNHEGCAGKNAAGCKGAAGCAGKNAAGGCKGNHEGVQNKETEKEVKPEGCKDHK